MWSVQTAQEQEEEREVSFSRAEAALGFFFTEREMNIYEWNYRQNDTHLHNLCHATFSYGRQYPLFRSVLSCN
jgi:hypothetical protein